MNQAAHQQQAEKLLALAELDMGPAVSARDLDPGKLEMVKLKLAAAQVHATLAMRPDPVVHTPMAVR